MECIHYICVHQLLVLDTKDEDSIYAARQGIRACNNTNMRNPIIKNVGGTEACY